MLRVSLAKIVLGVIVWPLAAGMQSRALAQSAPDATQQAFAGNGPQQAAGAQPAGAPTTGAQPATAQQAAPQQPVAAPTPQPAVQANARKIYVGLPIPQEGNGALNLQPNVRIAARPGSEPQAPAVVQAATQRPIAPNANVATARVASTSGPLPEMLPTPMGAPGMETKGDFTVRPPGMPLQEELQPEPEYGSFSEAVFGPELCATFRGWGALLGPRGKPDHPCDLGIGHERVALAPQEVEITQPLNNYRFRVDTAYRQLFPDRSEFFSARSGGPPGRGPANPETSVDWQEVKMLMEIGNKTFSTATEFPLRFVDPENNTNTGGFGDMTIATKLLLMDGKRWQITQFFKTTLNTGNAKRGLGTGHVSLEPGFLFRFQWTPETFLHSELRYMFPVPGDPLYAGSIFRQGFAISHLLYESDSFAAIPTLEMIRWDVLDGAQTVVVGPGVGFAQGIDSIGIVNLRPGIRFVSDTGGDMGLFELAVSGSFPISTDQWYDASLRLDLRWSY